MFCVILRKESQQKIGRLSRKINQQDTVDHLSQSVARLFGSAAVALLEALSDVEVAVIMRRKSKPLSHSFWVQTLPKME